MNRHTFPDAGKSEPLVPPEVDATSSEMGRRFGVNEIPPNGPDVIIELVGPGGTGKTTLSSNLAREKGLQVHQVAPTKGVRALFIGMAKALRLGLAHWLRPAEWLNLARNCAAVEHAIRETDNLRGTWVVDEGPVRCLRERRCNGGSELKAWTRYASSAVRRLEARSGGVRIICVDLDHKVRTHRYRERTRSEDKQRRVSSGIRSRFGLFLDERLGSRQAPEQLGPILDRMLQESEIATVEQFSASPHERPAEVTDRFARQMLGS